MCNDKKATQWELKEADTKPSFGGAAWTNNVDAAMCVIFSLYFPRWDFGISEQILILCEYWKYERGKECAENQRVMTFEIEE